MQTRRIRLASTFLLSLLLADTLLAACSGSASIRRTREDASLLAIAGYYQLRGELPPLMMVDGPKMARLAATLVRTQQPTTPNEAWTLIEYYSGLREKFEQKAKADGLPPDVIQAGLAEYDAKINALVDRAKELEARRARHRGTVWKRFFDGLGRAVGRAFDIGGKIVKFAIEDVPTGVVEYGPDLVREVAKAYVEKLRGELRTKGEQKAFEILAEKSPNLAAAYLIFKTGKEGVKVLRDFARLFGRHRRTTADRQSGGEFELPSTGGLVASCDMDFYHRWAVDPNRTILEESFALVVDFETRAFEIEFYGNDRTTGESQSQTSVVQFLGSGTVTADGWLQGPGTWETEYTLSPPPEYGPATTTGSLPIQWAGMVSDDLQSAWVEFCRNEEPVPSLKSMQSQGQDAFPGAFSCEYIFKCTGE